MSPQEQALQLMNEAAQLLGRHPAAGQFDAYPQYLSAADIMEILGVSKSKAHNIMDDPAFPLIRHGRMKRVEREQFFQFISQKAM